MCYKMAPMFQTGPRTFLAHSIYQVPSLQLAGRELATRYHSVSCVRPHGEHIPLPSSLTFPGSRWPVRPAGAQVPSPTELPFSAHANEEWAGVTIRSILGHTELVLLVLQCARDHLGDLLTCRPRFSRPGQVLRREFPTTPGDAHRPQSEQQKSVEERGW